MTTSNPSNDLVTELREHAAFYKGIERPAEYICNRAAAAIELLAAERDAANTMFRHAVLNEEQMQAKLEGLRAALKHISEAGPATLAGDIAREALGAAHETPAVHNQALVDAFNEGSKTWKEAQAAMTPKDWPKGGLSETPAVTDAAKRKQALDMLDSWLKDEPTEESRRQFAELVQEALGERLSSKTDGSPP